MSELKQKNGPEVQLTHHDQEPDTPENSPSLGDLELIRWALSLSLEERLAALQDFVDTFWTPRHG